MNKLLYWLVMLAAPVYRRAGADMVQLRAILWAKLLADDRKPLSIGLGRRQSSKPGKRSSIWGAILSFLIGFLYILPILGLEADLLLGLWASFTLFILMLGFLLLTDFSAILINTKDRYILNPRPVSGQTLLLARLLHIFIYLFRVVLPMSLPLWIVLGLLKWQLALWFPIAIVLLVSTILFLVMGVYIILLAAVKPERFQGTLSTVQILSSVLLFASYYIVPSVINKPGFATLTVADVGWVKTLPSYWIASTATLVYPALKGGWLFPVLAVLFPAVALWLTVRVLAPLFIRRLQGLDGADSASVPKYKTVSSKGGLAARLAQRMMKTPLARAGFLFAWIQSGRSASFRMRVFPTFAYVPVYFVYLVFIQNKSTAAETWKALPNSASHLGLLYMSAFVLMNVLNYINYSDQYRAAWIFHAAPLDRPGRLMSAAFTAVWIKYFMFFFLSSAVFVLWVWGISALPDILLAFCNVTSSCLLFAMLQHRYLPFSRMEQAKDRSGRGLRAIVIMLVPALFGGLHYLVWRAATGISLLVYLKYVLLLISAALLYLLWTTYARTAWYKMYLEPETNP